MATSWKFKLYVNNTTDRTLKVSSKNLSWGYWDLGDKEDTEPIDIEAHTNQEVLGIKAASGTWTGYECTCVWRDTSTAGNYGTLSLRVDVPFSASNESRLETSGLLHVDNWTDLPEKGHNFTRMIDLSLVGDEIQITGNEVQVTNDIVESEIQLDESGLEDEGYSVFLNQIMNNNDIVNDWEKLEKVREIESFEPTAELPEAWRYPPKILIGRSPVMDIPKKYWAGIGDPIFEALYQKNQFVDAYFAVGVYTVNTDPRSVETILAGVKTAVETSIEVTSSIKNTLTNHYSIKTSLSASGTVPTISLELAAAFESEFSVTNVTEVSSSKLERETKTVTIEASDKNRLFVQWLFSEAIAVYRKRKTGKVELIAISEWPTQAIDKVYEY